ncbi:MAG: tRNA uridine-5-carboxymethylaminomethyl(34) synthesis GTPase MnmE [bacterium]
MRHLSSTDTICAIATPPGTGGIGIVRISGPRAKEILGCSWRGRVHPSEFRPRTLYLGDFSLDSSLPFVRGGTGRGRSTPPFPSPPAGRRAGLQRRGISEKVHDFHDKVMAVFMPAPHTYTGDDVAEISCHGSQVVLSRILRACVAAGARLAGPGEFTRRAFMAGKLDLAQAEAVCDLINATSERGARLASMQLEGRLSREVQGAGSELMDLRASVEASIDFPEEGIEGEGSVAMDRLCGVIKRVEALASTHASGRMQSEGAIVAIVGRPNAGKSSVLNRLAGCDRAIVHHEPGTTRDVIEEKVSINGIEFRLRDTAGMRDARSEVEALGIGLAREEVGRADLVLAVFDGSRPSGVEDELVMELVRARPSIFVINKSDLPQMFDPRAPVSLRAIAKQSLAASSISAMSAPISISTITGEGIEVLRERLAEFVVGHGSAGLDESAVVTSARHKAVLDESLAALRKGMKALSSLEPLECVASHLRAAQGALGSITGEVQSEELLDRIFSRFCIGK